MGFSSFSSLNPGFQLNLGALTNSDTSSCEGGIPAPGCLFRARIPAAPRDPWPESPVCSERRSHGLGRDGKLGFSLFPWQVEQFPCFFSGPFWEVIHGIGINPCFPRDWDWDALVFQGTASTGGWMWKSGISTFRSLVLPGSAGNGWTGKWELPDALTEGGNGAAVRWDNSGIGNPIPAHGKSERGQRIPNSQGIRQRTRFGGVNPSWGWDESVGNGIAPRSRGRIPAILRPR